MERIEDKSKALSYIGIEIAESLKEIQNVEESKEDAEKNTEENISENESQDLIVQDQYIDNVVEKPSLWDRIKNMKLVRGIRYLMKIKVVLELPEPEHNDDK